MHAIVKPSCRFARLGCFLSAVAVLLIIPAAFAEEGEASVSMGFGGMMGGQERPAPESPQKELRVYKLEHADASFLVRLLENTLPVDLVADPRINSLIVSCSRELMDRFDSLVASLDVPSTSPASPGVQIYPLKHLRADEKLQEMLKKLVGGRDPRITTDPIRGLVIVAGETPETYKTIATILSELDSPAPQAPPDKSSLRVRIVWMLTGPDPGIRSDLSAVPDDLLLVVHELEDIGITGLGLVTQFVIGTDTEGEFEQNSLALLMGDPWTLNIEGEAYWSREDRATLDIAIRGSMVQKKETAEYRHPLPPTHSYVTSDLSLNTTFSAPLGHAVVLGVSPIGELTSVFVVQIVKIEH